MGPCPGLWGSGGWAQGLRSLHGVPHALGPAAQAPPWAGPRPDPNGPSVFCSALRGLQGGPAVGPWLPRSLKKHLVRKPRQGWLGPHQHGCPGGPGAPRRGHTRQPRARRTGAGLSGRGAHSSVLRAPSLSPVVALLGQQLLELAQGDRAASHQGPVGDGLSAEVVGHDNAVARLGTPTARLPLRFRPGGREAL